MKSLFMFIGLLVYWFIGFARLRRASACTTRRSFSVGGLIVLSVSVFGQEVDVKLRDAMQVFEQDSQMRHAIVGLAVLDAKSGKMIYGRNEQIGLAPASTQKIFTSTAAFELLGKDYRYKTELAYEGNIRNGTLKGDLYVRGSGDPTLGSWRYNDTKESVIVKKWADELAAKNVNRVVGSLFIQVDLNPQQVTPDGWIWQDIGNYYGAGARNVNWHENQYDLVLKSGENVGDSVSIVSVGGGLNKNNFLNELKTAAKGTGDNAYIYLSTSDSQLLVTGTIPAGEKAFTISGATPDPTVDLRKAFEDALKARGIKRKQVERMNDELLFKPVVIYTHYSPPMDSIVYWFMRRSINLYGEALVKTIGYEKSQNASTDTGVEIVRNFWASKGIDKSAINIIDGSGLSPQNRVTTDALAQVLFFAQSRPWFTSFYESLPTFNGMKLKSGSIGGARAFAGYHTSAQGKSYIVAIIVNNYSGPSAEIVRKMFRVLDTLK